jgi:hypothetical protein
MLIKLLLGFAVALFLTYPASVLTAIIEGQSWAAINSFHFPTSFFSYFLIAFPVFVIITKFTSIFRNIEVNKIPFGLIMIILVYSVLVFWNLGGADILGDDYDLAYQAYNLQDGIQAARKAFVISYNTHPPLFMSIKHYWFQIVHPWGLDTMPSWAYRGMEGIMGIAVILTIYTITKNYFATALLAVNNYMIMMGRVYLREMYLTFFITLSIYFFQKRNYLITAFLISCGLLIKTSVIVVLPVFLLILIYRKDIKNIIFIIFIIFIIYFPVLLYNFLAFITTGHLDATFSKIFGLAHPFLTGSASPIENIKNIYLYLKDIYSLPVLIIFVISSLLFIRNIYILILISSLLFFVFGGPLREYYLLFLTIPFVILTAKLPKIILFPLIIFSLGYPLSGNSNIRKIYEPSYGWPKLAQKVKTIYKPGDCLEKSGGVNDLAMRAYFQTDSVLNYPHYYRMCDEIASPAKKFKIIYNPRGVVEFYEVAIQ